MNAAITRLTNSKQKSVLTTSKDTLVLLEEKYLKGKSAHESVLLTDTPEGIEPVLSNSMELIKDLALYGFLRCS